MRVSDPVEAAVPTVLPPGFRYLGWSRTADGLTEHFGDAKQTITLTMSRFHGNICAAGQTTSAQYNGVKVFADTQSAWRCFQSLPPLQATAVTTSGQPSTLTALVASIQRLEGATQLPVTLHLTASTVTVNGYNLKGLSFANARAALGGATSCLPLSRGVRMVWTELMLRADYAGSGSCEAPAALQLRLLSVERDGSRTSQGLSIGDQLSKLKRLYPHAARQGTRLLLARHGALRVYALLNGTRVLNFRILAA